MMRERRNVLDDRKRQRSYIKNHHPPSWPLKMLLGNHCIISIQSLHPRMMRGTAIHAQGTTHSCKAFHSLLGGPMDGTYTPRQAFERRHRALSRQTETGRSGTGCAGCCAARRPPNDARDCLSLPLPAMPFRDGVSGLCGRSDLLSCAAPSGPCSPALQPSYSIAWQLCLTERLRQGLMATANFFPRFDDKGPRELASWQHGR